MPIRTPIDLDTYKRRKVYDAFKDRDLPTLSVSAHVDITALKQHLEACGEPFFVPLSYLISHAVNGVPELRHRIVDGVLYEYEHTDPAFTVLLDDDTFSFCDTRHGDDYPAYRQHTLANMAAVRACPDLSVGDKDHTFFITSLPWVSFTAISHPFDRQYASIPLISVGRHFRQGEALLLPVALQVHHGLADGIHVGRFFEALAMSCAAPATRLQIMPEA